MNSRSAKPSRFLAVSSPAEEAKEFLISLANLQDHKPAFEQLRRKFPDILEAVSGAMYVRYSPIKPKVYSPGSPEHDEINRSRWIVPLRDRLRAIWRAPDVATKQWGLFRISQDFFLRGDPAMLGENGLPYPDFALSWKPPTRTERFLLELMKWADLLKYCDNPDCAAPYFIATRRSQKYCHLDCSKPAQRESKKRWWKENGNRLRAVVRKKK